MSGAPDDELSGESDDEMPMQGPQSESDMIDALISGIIIIAAILFLIESQTLAGQALGEEDPGVAFWPRIVLVVILLFASLNLAFIFWRNKDDLRLDLRAASESLELPRIAEIETETRQFVAAIVLTGLYLFVLTDLGFLIATTLFLILFLWNLEYRSIVKNVVLSVVLTLFVFILFGNFMNIALPLGTEPFREIGIFVDNLV